MRLYKFFFILFFTLFLQNNSSADVPSYLDFKYILNSSVAGKKAQNFLKNKLETGLKDISQKEKNSRGRKKYNKPKENSFTRGI